MMRTISQRQLNTAMLIIVVLGTATAAALAIAAVIFATWLLQAALNSIAELIGDIASIYTNGDPLARLFILVSILFLFWKAAPRVYRFIRRQIDAAPHLFTRATPLAAGYTPRQSQPRPASSTHTAHQQTRATAAGYTVPTSKFTRHTGDVAAYTRRARQMREAARRTGKDQQSATTPQARLRKHPVILY